MKCKKEVQKLENSVKLILAITDFSLCTVRPIYDKGKFTSRQNEVNPALWLATHLSRSAVLITQEKSLFWLNNKSFNNQARWLYIDLDPLCVFIGRKEKNYLANKKPSWLQAWSYVQLFNKTNRKNIHKASEEMLSYQKWSKYSCSIFSYIVTITSYN